METVRFVNLPICKRTIMKIRTFITPANLQTLREEYKFADLLFAMEDSPVISDILEWLAVSGWVGPSDQSLPGPINFRFGHRIFSFGPMEFALITGLSFSPFPEVRAAFHDTPFVRLFIPYQLERPVTFGNLQTLLENESRNNPDSVLVRKLVVLYLLHTMVFLEGSRGTFCRRAIPIVDDPAIFNSFPWGRLLYRNVVEEWKKIFRRVNETMHGVTRFYLNTFPFALHAWVLESLHPQQYQLLVNRCEGDPLPRLLRWKTIPMPDYPAAMDAIFTNPDVPFVKLEPTEEEEATDYVRSVANM